LAGNPVKALIFKASEPLMTVYQQSYPQIRCMTLKRVAHQRLTGSFESAPQQTTPSGAFA
jgi:hypothetical protein